MALSRGKTPLFLMLLVLAADRGHAASKLWTNPGEAESSGWLVEPKVGYNLGTYNSDGSTPTSLGGIGFGLQGGYVSGLFSIGPNFNYHLLSGSSLITGVTNLQIGVISGFTLTGIPMRLLFGFNIIDNLSGTGITRGEADAFILGASYLATAFLALNVEYHVRSYAKIKVGEQLVQRSYKNFIFTVSLPLTLGVKSLRTAAKNSATQTKDPLRF
jgi:hypothetical protein